MSLFPTAAVREAMAGSSSMKSPIAEGMMLRMKSAVDVCAGTVGALPATPLTRSSYHADRDFAALRKARQVHERKRRAIAGAVPGVANGTQGGDAS